MNVCLLFTTARGDEFGRLPLEDVVMAAAGEITESSPTGQMPDIYAHIRTAVEREGLTITLAPMDFEFEVSRALLGAPEGDTLLIRLPVETQPSPDGTASTGRTPITPHPDDLFDLNDPKEDQS